MENITKPISMYKLAKIAGVKYQSLRQLSLLGYLKVERKECSECGSSTTLVTPEVANKYLAGRAERLARKSQ